MRRLREMLRATEEKLEAAEKKAELAGQQLQDSLDLIVQSSPCGIRNCNPNRTEWLITYYQWMETRGHRKQAAEMLGVSVETLRRWEADGRLAMERTEGGQRLVRLEDVARLRDERRRATTPRPTVGRSARNQFPGIVTRIERDKVAAVVEVQAGPHRVVSLMTAEAVDELGLRVGDEAVCIVKATNVIVEVPSSRESRG